jgi:hypothetical protein
MLNAMQIDTRLFEPQIISLVLTFLDQCECGRLQYTSKAFDVYLNNLEFQISKTRLISKTPYLQWITSRRMRFLEFYCFRNNLSSTDIQNFAEIIMQLTTDLAKIEFLELGNWNFFISSLKMIARVTAKPSHTLRRMHLDFPYRFGVFDDLFMDLGVFADLFPVLEEFKLRISYYPVDFPRLGTLKSLTKLWISGNLYFGFLIDYSVTLQWTSLLQFTVIANENISDSCIDVLTKCSILLEEVQIIGCDRITNRSIHSLAKYCKLLRSVKIFRCLRSEMHAVFMDVQHTTNNFRLSFDPNLFLLSNTKEEDTCFPIGCHVMFGQKLELVVDRDKNYLFVPFSFPRLPSVIIDLTVDDFEY